MFGTQTESPRKHARIRATTLLWGLFVGLIALRLAVAGYDRLRAQRQRAQPTPPAVYAAAMATPMPTLPPVATLPAPSPTASATRNAPTVTQGVTLPSVTATAVAPPTLAPPTAAAAPRATPDTVPTFPSAPPAVTGRIIIPALMRDAPIVTVSWHVKVVGDRRVAVWDTVSGAVGHHRGSAPLGGPGNTVLSGHTGGRNGGVFNGLWNLKPGDAVQVVDAEGQAYDYVVQEVIILQEVGATLEERLKNAEAMAPTEDTRLTLITCWPEWVYTHRVIVVARPAPS